MTGTYVVDYFFVCGCDDTSEEATVEITSPNVDKETTQASWRRRFVPKVLVHYPDSRPGCSFDADATSLLALPDGVDLWQARDEGAGDASSHLSPPSPALHCFVITREDGSRVYGFSYIFYESAPDHLLLLPPPLSRDEQESAGVSAGNTEFFSSASSVVVSPTSQSSCHTAHRDVITPVVPSSGNAAQPRVGASSLFVSKCIGVLMSQPHLNLAFTFLSRLYRHSQLPCSPLPLESHVGQLLYQLQPPAVGTCLRVPAVGAECLLQLPAAGRQLPLLEHSLAQLVALVGTKQLVTLCACMLLEYQMIFVSHSNYRLTLAAETLSALLFPFSWPHVYVPVLPRCLVHFLDAPVPYLMGLTAHVYHHHVAHVPAGNVCTVELDSGVVTLPEDIPSLPGHAELLEELDQHLASQAIYQQHLQNSRLSRTDRTTGQASSLSAAANFTAAATDDVDQSDNALTDHHWEIIEPVQPAANAAPTTTAAANTRGQAAQHEMYPGQNESLRRISQLVKNTGLDMKRLHAKLEWRRGSQHDLYLAEQRCNSVVRELVLNRLVQTLHAYDQFVIQPRQNMDSWLACRESCRSFDSAAFLSDQPRQHLPFLSRFIETQLFVGFIDRKLLVNWGELDAELELFDARIRRVRQQSECLVHTPSSERCTIVPEADAELLQHLQQSCADSPLPLQVSPAVGSQRGNVAEKACNHRPTTTATAIAGFPRLDAALIGAVQAAVVDDVQIGGAAGRRDRLSHLNRSMSDARQQLQQLQLAPPLITSSPDAVRENNWKFIEHALKECKNRTKRLLVEKMGIEAVALGHHSAAGGGLEENTLVTSLCDLVERIWTHGRVEPQGKSALWAHLCTYRTHLSQQQQQDLSATDDQSRPSSSAKAPISTVSVSAPASPLPAIRSSTSARGSPSNSVASTSNVLRPLPVSPLMDMNNVMSMRDVCTDIGYSRAWMRLSLEKKLLAKHLRALLSDDQLLRDLYKPHAFLRSEEEREQLLCHLLSLNAVDYFSFSKCYPSAVVLYRVVILTCSRKASAASTTANVWLRIAGSLTETSVVHVPRHVRHITFKHQNLGVLSTVVLGHDNAGASPNWRVEHLLVRNELTTSVTCFPCGRWLGRSIDDGSTERVLVGRTLDQAELSGMLATACGGDGGDGGASGVDVRCRSPSVTRRLQPRRNDVYALRQTLGDAVNAIVKYFHRPQRERGPIALLLCGEMGLVPTLQQVFLFGFRSNRLFGRNLYLWDYLSRVRQQIEFNLLQSQAPISPPPAVTPPAVTPPVTPLSPAPPQSPPPSAVAGRQRALCRLIGHVDRTNQALGKDDRFHVWLLIALRDRCLADFVGELAVCSVTPHMFDETAFLRAPEPLHALVQLLVTLHDYELRPEPSLMRGVCVPVVPSRGRRSHSVGPRCDSTTTIVRQTQHRHNMVTSCRALE